MDCCTDPCILACWISLWAVFLVVLICTISLVLFLSFAKARYDAIADLSNRIDDFLHDDYSICLTMDEVGKLAVLSSELSKMTLCLKEKKDRLETEKHYLSDTLTNISYQRTPLISIRVILDRLESEPLSLRQHTSLHKAETLMNRTHWLIDALVKTSQL